MDEKKPKEALLLLDSILKDYKTDPIIDQVLLFQAHLYESQKQYMKAASNYSQIIKDHEEEILVDDAYFYWFLGKWMFGIRPSKHA